MSDLMTGCEPVSEGSPFVQAHRAAAPAAPDASSLERVRLRAMAPVRRGRPFIRAAIALAAAAAVVVAGLWAFAPRNQDAAFATDQAIGALLPRGGVLHTKATVIENSETDEYGALKERRQTWEDWIDVDRRVTRMEARELPTGRLGELSVRVGNFRRLMAVQYGLDLKKNEYVCLGVEQIIEMPDTTPITSPGGGLVDLLRTTLASGEARQVGREVIDGQEYWVVELSRQLDGEEFPTVLRATMRVGDYRLKSFEQRSEQRNGNGHGSGSMVLEYTVWEVLERSAIPADFFSLDAPIKAAKPGTKIETREEPNWDGS
ncbi:MAG: hypothetical protein Q7W30_08070 [Coriobacteriia bacterium]|nr:hypothetical protein [Coriobacteriia bacterium]